MTGSPLSKRGFNASPDNGHKSNPIPTNIAFPNASYVRSFAIQALVLQDIPLWLDTLDLKNPSMISIQNLGPNPIYYGLPGVTVLTGTQLAAGSQTWLDNIASKTGVLSIIGSVADQISPADTRVLIFTSI